LIAAKIAHGLSKGLKKAVVSYERHYTTATLIALAILAIVVLFCRRGFIMNSMEGSQTIPTFVELKNALLFGSRLNNNGSRQGYVKVCT
jgi:hypothetical protein